MEVGKKQGSNISFYMDGRKLNSAACVTQVSNVLTCKYLEGFYHEQ